MLATVPPPWLPLISEVARDEGKALVGDEATTLAMALVPFVAACADDSPEMVATICRNYLRDHELVQALQQGPGGADFDQATAIIWEWITTFTTHRFGHDGAANLLLESHIDVNSWEDICRNLDKFHYQSRLQTFVFGVITNRWKRFLRDRSTQRQGGEGVQPKAVREHQKQTGVLPRRRRDGLVSLEAEIVGQNIDGWLIALETSVEESVERREAVALLQRAFAHLHRKYATEHPLQVLKAYYWQDRTLEEIGQQFGMTRNRVWQDIRRYRRDIQHWLAGRGYTA